MGRKDKKKPKKEGDKKEEEKEEKKATKEETSASRTGESKIDDAGTQVDDKKESDKDSEKEEDKDETKNRAFDMDAEKPEVKEEPADEDENDKKPKKRGRPSKDEEKPAPTASGREKRARKSVAEASYKPENFSQVDNAPHFIDGTGTQLRDLEAVKDSIESYKDNADELAVAYRFLYSTRGRINTKEIKNALLRFNGYLPEPADGAEEADIEKAETAAEKKYATKAYKLTVPALKKLCNVFAVDRSKASDKDKLVDVLLDFLSKPSEEPLKGSKKAAAGSKKKKESKSKKTSSATLDDYEEIVEGEMPDDKQLRQWVRAYVRCFNTAKNTLKDAMEIAEEKFGVNLKEKKDRIKELLTEEM